MTLPLQWCLSTIYKMYAYLQLMANKTAERSNQTLLKVEVDVAAVIKFDETDAKIFHK